MPSKQPPPSARPTIHRHAFPEVVAAAVGSTRVDPHTQPTNRRARDLLDQALAGLAALGVPTPAATQQALDLTAELLNRPTGIGAWIAGQPLDALTPAAITAAMRDYMLAAGVATAMGSAHDAVGNETTAALLDRARDGLAESLDEIAATLRPRWDEAAAVVTAAVDAGITSTTSAEEAIGSDTMVGPWRDLGVAVALLGRIEQAWLTALFVCGIPLGHDEQPRRGRGAWLDSAGRLALLGPSQRPVLSAAERTDAREQTPLARYLGERIGGPAVLAQRATDARLIMASVDSSGWPMTAQQRRRLQDQIDAAPVGA